MNELDSKELLVPHRAPITFILATHLRDHKTPYPEYLDEALKRSDNKKVAYFIEGYSAVSGTTKRINAAIDSGLPPSLAIQSAELTDEPLMDVNNFYQAQYEMLDFFHESSEGRIKIINEEHSRQTLHKLNRNTGRMRGAQKAANTYTLLGNFDLAVKHLNNYVRVSNSDTQLREADISNQLLNFATTLNIGEVVVRIGALHTSLVKIMNRRGFQTTTHFPETLNGSFIYDPVSSISMKLLDNPNDRISQVEWFQCLIGESYARFVLSANHKLGYPLDFPELIGLVWKFLDNFQDLKSIRQFEQALRSGKSRDGVENFQKVIGKETAEEFLEL